MTTFTDVTYEPVAELKFGQVGIANLKLKRLDSAALGEELDQKVASAPQLFSRAPVILDLSHLSTLPDITEVCALLERIRSAGMLPVGLSYGTRENEELARTLNLPLLAKFRAVYEPAGETAAPPPASTESKNTPRPLEKPIPQSLGGQHHDKAVRSGQQIYGRGRDLILTAAVGNGAEVIADGSIHIYSALRGRAFAGANGDQGARIYCSEFHAELISIAGQYRVFEDIPTDLRGKPVQVRLVDEKLVLTKIG